MKIVPIKIAFPIFLKSRQTNTTNIFFVNCAMFHFIPQGQSTKIQYDKQIMDKRCMQLERGLRIHLRV